MQNQSTYREPGNHDLFSREKETNREQLQDDLNVGIAAIIAILDEF